MADLKLIIPSAVARAEILVREHPGFFHAIILDEWRGVRLILDSNASQGCDNRCRDCPHFRLFPCSQEQGDDLKVTLFEFTDATDLSLYGKERFLPCKTMARYARCFVNCILFDPALRLYVELQKELKLVRDFVVVYTDLRMPTGVVEQTLKRRIVTEALSRLEQRNQTEAETLRDVLSSLDWDFDAQVFRE